MFKLIFLFCTLVALGLSYQYYRFRDKEYSRVWYGLRVLILILIAITGAQPSILLPSNQVHELMAIDTSASMIPYKDYVLELANNVHTEEDYKTCIGFSQTVGPFDAETFGLGQTTDLRGLFDYLKATYGQAPLKIELVTDGRITESIPSITDLEDNWTIITKPVQGLSLVDVAISTLEVDKVITLTYQATSNGQAQFIISGEKGRVLDQMIAIEKGSHQVTFPLDFVLEDTSLKGHLIFPGDQVPYNDVHPLEYKPLDKYEYLIISENPDALPKALTSLLTLGDIGYMTLGPEQINDRLLRGNTYEGMIIYDCPGQVFSPHSIQAMKDAIHNLGKSCFVIGGPNSFGLGSYAAYGLEDFMPVEDKLSGPEEQGNSALVVVLDTSGSMEDKANGTKKITMAKSGVASVLKTLHPEDYFGLMGFSDSYEWLLPLQAVSDMPSIKNDFLTIGAKGGTLIKPSLVMAYQALSQKPLKGLADKHILLITDGQGDQEAYEDLINQLEKKDITLSTIGIGKDIAENFLMDLAKRSKGSYHKVESIADLPSIMVRDIYENAKATHQQGVFVINDPQTGEQKGRLNQYIATSLKEDSQVLLTLESLDPLLVTRPYGIGQVGVLTTNLDKGWTGTYLSNEDNLRDLLNLFIKLPLNVGDNGMTLKINDNRMSIYLSDENITRLDLIYQGRKLVSQTVTSDTPFLYPIGNQLGIYHINAYDKNDVLIGHQEINQVYSSEFKIETQPLWIEEPELFNHVGRSLGQKTIKTMYITWPIICLLFIGSVYYRGK